jgi:integrase
MKKSNQSELNFLNEFKKYITASHKGKRVKKDGSKILKDTLKKLDATYNLLRKFSEEKQFQLRFRILQRNKREINSEKLYWKRFYLKFTDYLYKDLDCYDNYVGSVIKDIRCFFNYLIRERNLSVGNFHQQFYIYKEDIQILTLQPDQLKDLIINREVDEQLRPVLVKTKDILLAGCAVALRYSDLMNLQKANLQLKNQQYFLKVQSKKTKAYTHIKLPDYVMEIFKKYSRKGNRLLPYFNIVRLNLYLKEIAEHLGWTDEVVKTRQKRGKAIIIYKNAKQKTHFRFCDLISTHIMRRTAITTMLRLEMPEHLVRKISGHAPHSKEFHKYVSISQNYLDDETDKVFAKLTGAKPS